MYCKEKYFGRSMEIGLQDEEEWTQGRSFSAARSDYMKVYEGLLCTGLLDCWRDEGDKGHCGGSPPVSDWM